MQKYLAQFTFGNVTAESIARVMVYARALGTSITTSFATSIILYNYFRNTRKHQERIFEIRKELGEDDPYRKQDKE